MVKSPYRPTSDSYGDRCGMLVFSCIKHEAITSLWALLEKPFNNLHFLQNISQKIQSLCEYLWGTILMTRSGTFVYMRWQWDYFPRSARWAHLSTGVNIVTSRRSARICSQNIFWSAYLWCLHTRARQYKVKMACWLGIQDVWKGKLQYI